MRDVKTNLAQFKYECVNNYRYLNPSCYTENV